MIKLIMILVFGNICQTTLGQTRQDEILFEVASYNEFPKHESDFKIFLTVKNESKFPIILPCSYFPMQNNELTNVYYNIMLINKESEDSITKFSMIKGFDSQYSNLCTYKILEPSHSNNFYSSIESDYFKKPGVYRISFHFRLSRFNKFYSDLETKPIFLRIKE